MALTRRQIFARGGALAGSLALVPLPRMAAAVEPAAGVLSAAATRTYIALVEAVGSVPSNDVDSARTGFAVERFTEMLTERPLSTRDVVERLLTRIDAGPQGASFSQRTVKDRVAFLRSWASLKGPAHVEKRATIETVLRLAGLPFYPDPVEFHPTPVAI